MAQLLNELAEKELIKKFGEDHSWLSDIPAKNNWVNNDVIKIPRQGTAPQVLINNTVYPIQSSGRTDDFLTLSLNKYDTENTDVTDDELYALPYEKTSDVQVQHREELERKTARHGLFSVAVNEATNNMPVLVATGDIDPTTGRRRLITADLVRLWEALGKKSVPLAGRGIVLSVEHAADLMLEDSNRQKAWGQEWLEGKVPVSHCGFRLWVSVYTPTYELINGVWTRKAFEAMGGEVASIVYHRNSCAKATGSVKRYARPADQDPENRKNTIGFRLWAGVFPILDTGAAALVSETP